MARFGGSDFEQKKKEVGGPDKSGLRTSNLKRSCLFLEWDFPHPTHYRPGGGNLLSTWAKE